MGKEDIGVARHATSIIRVPEGLSNREDKDKVRLPRESIR